MRQGQLCQKQATGPAKAGRRGADIALWLGLALLALGSG
ncbi:4-amino-4-deoxy-L-arabinose-phospho-UDP flippase, partial [Enterobacter asburiae]